MKKAAVVIFDNFEEMEAVSPVDILRRAGIQTTLAAMGTSTEVVGRSKIKITADSLLSDITADTFDAVVLSGGSGVQKICSDTALLEFLRRHFECKKIVAAICAAPIILKNAGILDGKKVTAHTSVIDRLTNADSRADVVRDANIITSRGAGTAAAFGLEIVSALEGTQKAIDISASICYTPRI